MSQTKIHWQDFYDLAAAVLGYSEDDNPDLETIEQEIADKFDVSMDQFRDIAKALIPFTVPAQAAVTGTKYQGFVRDGNFIVKQEAST